MRLPSPYRAVKQALPMPQAPLATFDTGDAVKELLTNTIHRGKAVQVDPSG